MGVKIAHKYLCKVLGTYRHIINDILVFWTHGNIIFFSLAFLFLHFNASEIGIYFTNGGVSVSNLYGIYNQLLNLTHCPFVAKFLAGIPISHKVCCINQDHLSCLLGPGRCPQAVNYMAGSLRV